jgi:predicted dehydrogenase
MPSLADLHAAVQSAIACGRIGQPVFVRYHLNGLLADPSALLRDIAPTVGEWVGQPPHPAPEAVTTSADRAEQTSAVVGFPNGASALLSTVSGQVHGAGADLTVLGTRGAIYHTYDGGDPLWDDEPALPTEAASAKRQAPYGVLLVSGGHTHQELYAPAFAADPRCRLVAVTDEPDVDPRRRELNERFARALGLPYLPDLGDALARLDVHIASVCAPPERRGRIAVRCAEAGKHLYLDKSLAPTRAEADAVVAAVRRAGVRSQMFTFVTAPWARRAKAILRADRCGRLLAVHADTFFAKGHAGTARLGPRREEYPPARHQLTEAKREWDNVGVYPVALVRWLTGQAFRSAYGVTANYFFAEHQRHDVEDFGLLAGRLEDGTAVTIAAGRCGWASHPAGGVNRVVLVGSEATLVLDANRPRLEVCAAEPPWAPPPAHPEDPMAFWQSTQDEVGARPKRAWLPVTRAVPGDVSCFLDALDAGRDGEVSAAEAAQATAVLLAGYRSAADGAVCCLSPGGAVVGSQG